VFGKEFRRTTLSIEKFSLDASPKNNYVNLILNDVKNFDYWKENNEFHPAIRALNTLLLDLPPHGQEYMKQEIQLIFAFEKNVSVISHWADVNRIYQKTMTWIWPNLLQEYFQAKPKNPQPTMLGES
jgi:hypothetical protein